MLLEDLDPGLFVTPERFEHSGGYSGCECTCMCVMNRHRIHLLIACSQADGLGSCKKVLGLSVLPLKAPQNLSCLQKHQSRSEGSEMGALWDFQRLNQ